LAWVTTGGDIEGITTAADSGLAGGATTGTPSLSVDFSNLSTSVTLDVANDGFAFNDITDGSTNYVPIHTFVEAINSTGLTATTGQLSVNASQTQITGVGALTTGSIAPGFGSISTEQTITTTGSVIGTSFPLVSGTKIYFDGGTNTYIRGILGSAPAYDDEIMLVAEGVEAVTIRQTGTDFHGLDVIGVGDIEVDSVSSAGSTAPVFKGTGSSGATEDADSVTNAGLYIQSNVGTGFGMALGTTSAGDAYIQGVYQDGTSGTKYIILNPYGSGVIVTGAFSKGSGSFLIPHPLPSMNDTHNLVHSFVEGPRADLIYRGSVALSGGSASVDLDAEVGMTDGTWELLCRDPQVFLQNESGWSALKGSVSGSTLIITCKDSISIDTVSWMVVAERQDEHMKDSGTDWTDSDGRPILEPLKRTS
jgi:hypothetical protein